MKNERAEEQKRDVFDGRVEKKGENEKGEKGEDAQRMAQSR